MKYVLFVCTHNAGRSQMAQALFERYAPDDVRGESAGSDPAARVWPEVIEVMREVGIDLSRNKPKRLTVEMQLHADWAVTMGCGDVCPYVPTTVDDWDIPDPAGKPSTRSARSATLIDERVHELATNKIARDPPRRDLAPVAAREAAAAADRGVRRYPPAGGDPRLRRPGPRRLRRRPDPQPHPDPRAQADARLPAPRALRAALTASGPMTSTPPLPRRLLAELLGSAFLAALVIGSGIAAQQLSPGDIGLELFENAAATAAGLFTIILMFGPVSGGHFNPVVSLVDASFGGLSWRDALAYIPAQVTGCILGAIAANVMFALAAVSISTKHRASPAHLFAEVIATARPDARDLRARAHQAIDVTPGGRRRLHRRRLLLHQLDQLRQPRDHDRADVLKHVRRDRARVGARVHRRAARRRGRRDRRRPDPVPRRHARGRRRGRAPPHRRTSDARPGSSGPASEPPRR